MKLITLFSILLGGGALSTLQATPDSAYASATLDLTSSNANELATGIATAGAGYANAMAVPGVTENALMTHGSAGGTTSFQNESVSGFGDRVTINAPGLTGSAGSLEFHFMVSGTEAFAATTPALSSITASADFTAPGVTDDLSFTKDSTGAVVGTDFLGVPETVDVDFVFGTPFTISLDIAITALVQGLTGSGSAMASGTFSSTSSMDHVMSAVLQSPLTPSSYTASSASGANYFTTTAVPEPGGMLLVLAGLAALPLAGRWRRR